jgi:hypothetical protein
MDTLVRIKMWGGTWKVGGALNQDMMEWVIPFKFYILTSQIILLPVTTKFRNYSY